MTNALIEELQAGPGSRELSDRVLLAVGYKGSITDPKFPGLSRPSPTENLQDAVDLVPAEAVWTVFSDFPGDMFWAEITFHDAPGMRKYREGPESSPALALCIALIKARSL